MNTFVTCFKPAKVLYSHPYDRVHGRWRIIAAVYLGSADLAITLRSTPTNAHQAKVRDFVSRQMTNPAPKRLLSTNSRSQQEVPILATTPSPLRSRRFLSVRIQRIMNPPERNE